MNIFILSKNPKRCARYHCNKHVVKMILESAQLLCIAHRILDDVSEINDTKLYGLTHKNHPCAKWVRESFENYLWLYNLFIELCNEYTFRYDKIHLSDIKYRKVLSQLPNNIPMDPMTNFALAMPDLYKGEDAVESYRNYYLSEKRYLCVWKRRKDPYWFN
jgi:hypothetical protein